MSFWNKKEKKLLDAFNQDPAEDALRGKDGAASQIKAPKWRREWKAAPAGAAWNPLREFPVNHMCFCGSGRKAKKCCLPRLSACLSKETAKYLESNWADLLSGKLTLPAAPVKENV